VAVPIYIPTSSVEGFPFLHTLCSIYYFLFSDGNSDRSKVIQMNLLQNRLTNYGKGVGRDKLGVWN